MTPVQTVETAFKTVLHDSLHTYQIRNSARPGMTDPAPEQKKGAIAVFRNKVAMQQAHGVVITSFEGLNKIAPTITHWTPNTFNYLGYTDNRYSIRGHEERNLSQINAFVVDIDCNSAMERDSQWSKISEALVIDGVMIPTMVLRTDKGYHAYYVLDQPMFVRQTKGRFPVITTAGMIANNLKQAIKKELPQVDVSCNNFGIFRIPRVDNLIHFEANLTFSATQLISWSQRYSKIHSENAATSDKVVSFAKRANGRQVDQAWFKKLLKVTNITSGQGMARHNAVLTLALAAFQSAWSQDRAFDVLDEFNSNLAEPLPAREVAQAVSDAFSGKYHGAATLYVQGLAENWIPELVGHISVGMGWYKFAKPRSQRQYSHKHEWATDVLTLLNEVQGDDRAVSMSTREIQERLGISPASLNRVLKTLVDNNQLKVEKHGNQAASMVTLTMLFRTALRLKNEQNKQWVEYVRGDNNPAVEKKFAGSVAQLEMFAELIPGPPNVASRWGT